MNTCQVLVKSVICDWKVATGVSKVANVYRSISCDCKGVRCLQRHPHAISKGVTVVGMVAAVSRGVLDDCKGVTCGLESGNGI